MKSLILKFSCAIFFLLSMNLKAEDGYKLWLRYAPIKDQDRFEAVKSIMDQMIVSGTSSTFEVIREELLRASSGMLGMDPLVGEEASEQASLIIGTPSSCKMLDNEEIRQQLESLGPEGYYIAYLSSGDDSPLIIVANEDAGALYGTFHLLRLLQASGELSGLPITEAPRIKLRLLNHWDNLDRTVERAYAGFSLCTRNQAQLVILLVYS